MTPNTHNKPVTTTLFAVALLGVVALSGCLGFDSDAGEGTAATGTNQAPVAYLDSLKGATWASEPITFDGQSSYDPDGYITLWRFDFGDGTVVEVDNEDAARLEHTYKMGGVYNVTLTVFDDAKQPPAQDSDNEADTDNETDSADENEDAMDPSAFVQNATTTLVVAVNERLVVDASVVDTMADATSQFATESFPFQGNMGVERYELELDLTSTLVTGDTMIHIAVTGADNETLAEKTVSVGPAENETASLGGLLVAGTYTLTITSESGAATVDGALRTYYVPTLA